MSGYEQAEILALEALGWMAANDLLDPFMGATGAERDQIAAAATDPAFLAAVLDFLMMSDDWVIGFCREKDLSHDRLMSARAMLPGGDLPHWT